MVFSVALGYIKHPAVTCIAREPLRSPRRSRRRRTPARVLAPGSRGTHACGTRVAARATGGQLRGGDGVLRSGCFYTRDVRLGFHSCRCPRYGRSPRSSPPRGAPTPSPGVGAAPLGGSSSSTSGVRPQGLLPLPSSCTSRAPWGDPGPDRTPGPTQKAAPHRQGAQPGPSCGPVSNTGGWSAAGRQGRGP